MSVVVPTHNRLDTLLRVLDGLVAQTLPQARFEVIVVDDGSTDGTPERLDEARARLPLSLRLIRRANRGPASARNAGLRAAQGEIVLFIDDDCIPHPQLLEQHLASHEAEGLGVIGRIIWDPSLPLTPFMAFTDAEFFTYHQIKSPQDAPFACYFTGNASVDRRAALAVGGYDDDFPYALHEDIDFGYRLRLHGVRFIFNPAAVVLHHRSAEFRPTLAQRRRTGREIMRFWTKHPELRELTPFYGLADPAWRRAFYHDVMGYYVHLGMEEACATARMLDAREVLPEDFRDEVPLAMDARVRSREREAEAARQSRQRTLDEIDQVRRRAHELEAQQQRLAGAYADLEAETERLRLALANARPRGLLDRLGWRTRPAAEAAMTSVSHREPQSQSAPAAQPGPTMEGPQHDAS